MFRTFLMRDRASIRNITIFYICCFTAGFLFLFLFQKSCQVEKWKLKVENYFAFGSSLFSLIFLIIVTNIAISSLQSLSNELNILSSRYFVSWSRSSQYSVSSASLRAIFNLLRKSMRLCAFLDSLVFAPMLVPHRKSCFDITCSCFFSIRNL